MCFVQINVTVEKGGEVCPPREEPSLLSFVAVLVTHYDRLFISLSCLLLIIGCVVIGKVTDNIDKILERNLLGLAFVVGDDVSREHCCIALLKESLIFFHGQITILSADIFCLPPSVLPGYHALLGPGYKQTRHTGVFANSPSPPLPLSPFSSG